MKELDEDILDRYLNNEYTEEDLKIISDWLKESDEHAGYLFRMEEFLQFGKFNESTDGASIDAAGQRLFKKIELLNEEKNNRKNNFHLRRWSIVAAVVLLAVGVGVEFLFRKNLFQTDQNQVELITEADVTEVQLPDGTKVWLNRYSVLKYPLEFAKDIRQVFLEGEAYFEVISDHSSPFVVESELLTVRVLGTTFNFKTRQQTDKVEVSLIEGEVQVKESSGEGMIILTPGQRAELDKNNKRLTVQQVDANLDAVWHNDLIPFNQASISYIAKVLEQFYDMTFILSPELNVTTTYSGVVRKKDGIKEVLTSLQNVIPIHYEIVGNKIFLYSATR